ncbi:S-adenosylmethionine sensor upstream of mTORC1, partial [Frankliniella fusca]
LVERTYREKVDPISSALTPCASDCVGSGDDFGSTSAGLFGSPQTPRCVSWLAARARLGSAYCRPRLSSARPTSLGAARRGQPAGWREAPNPLWPGESGRIFPGFPVVCRGTVHDQWSISGIVRVERTRRKCYREHL